MIFMVAVVCPPLSPLTIGTISYSDNTLGVDSVATYSCDAGYAPKGDITRTCLSGGTWSGSAPTCEGEVLAAQCVADSWSSAHMLQLSHVAQLPLFTMALLGHPQIQQLEGQ